MSSKVALILAAMSLLALSCIASNHTQTTAATVNATLSAHEAQPEPTATHSIEPPASTSVNGKTAPTKAQTTNSASSFGMSFTVAVVFGGGRLAFFV